MILKLTRLAREFRADTDGGVALQSALLFGGIGVAMALLLAPQLRDASDRYAMKQAIGIDYTMTGGIEKQEQPKRYVIRKSVLDPQ